MAKRKGGQKGSPFEREICKILSIWWTEGERDDVFWRTSQSGGRATQRKKSNQSTFGQHGDIQATDPVGQPLMDACCFELKIGYKKWSFLDVLDKPAKGAKQVVEKFMEQVEADTKLSGAKWPVLLTKRDRREKVITFPRKMYYRIEHHYGRPSVYQWPIVIRITTDNRSWICMRFNDFLEWCRPEFFKK